MLGFIFHGFSRAKTDLHSKYIVNFKFGWFFEQYHLLNLFILGVYAKRWPEFAHIQNRNWGPFHRKDFKWKKIYGDVGLVSEKKNGRFVCRT